MPIKEIKFLTEATGDVRKIQDYLSDYKGVYTKLVSRFNTCVKIVKNNPDLGKKGRRDNTREFFVHNTEYVIVYRVKEDVLEILTILHTSRKY